MCTSFVALIWRFYGSSLTMGYVKTLGFTCLGLVIIATFNFIINYQYANFSYFYFITKGIINNFIPHLQKINKMGYYSVND